MTSSPLKILQVNRHMNIGGVETYLYRLCAGLTARGHQVGLLTEGGLWETKAVEAGARLHKVKSLSKDWESTLPELSAQGYQLVHGHNYHSARIAKRIAARLDLPYVMSVHGPRPRLKQLFFRDWSPEVVVMSEGDRDNICWPGGISAQRSTLSFYGIDTDRFHPGMETASLRDELGLSHDARIIVFVSRFSNRKADVGHSLLKAMPALKARYDNLHLLLVGEGPEGAALKAHAEQLGKTLGVSCVRMIGPRRDVERFMSLADIAVCTANTALEAMACGTPTIAAGRTGYFGLIGPGNFDKARALCFADHGRSPEPMTPRAFERDIPGILDQETNFRANAELTASMVAEQMSVTKMAQQMEGIYLRNLRA